MVVPHFCVHGAFGHVWTVTDGLLINLMLHGMQCTSQEESWTCWPQHSLPSQTTRAMETCHRHVSPILYLFFILFCPAIALL